MLRFVGGFFQNNLSQAQQHTVLLHFPSGTFGLRFRRNFCFDINFAIHIQNPEAKWKITCQFSFLFGALLSCSNVTTKMLWACGKKTGGGGGGRGGINWVYQTRHPTHTAPGAHCLLRCPDVLQWHRKHSLPLQHSHIAQLSHPWGHLAHTEPATLMAQV